MDIFELIKSRRAIREFEQRTVSREVMETIVQAGIWAPSAMNGQPWRFVVVQDPAELKSIAHEARIELANYLKTPEAEAEYGKENCEHFMPRGESEDGILYSAPAIVFVIGTQEPDQHFDQGLAAQNMMLCAHGLGVGSCPIGLAEPLNNSEKIKALFDLKSNEKIVIALVFGYPAENPEPTHRNFDVVKWIG
jgi:nitroreductase